VETKYEIKSTAEVGEEVINPVEEVKDQIKSE